MTKKECVALLERSTATIRQSTQSFEDTTKMQLELGLALQITMRLVDDLAQEANQLRERLERANAALESEGLGPF